MIGIPPEQHLWLSQIFGCLPFAVRGFKARIGSGNSLPAEESWVRESASKMRCLRRTRSHTSGERFSFTLYPSPAGKDSPETIRALSPGTVAASQESAAIQVSRQWRRFTESPLRRGQWRLAELFDVFARSRVIGLRIEKSATHSPFECAALSHLLLDPLPVSIHQRLQLVIRLCNLP